MLILYLLLRLILADGFNMYSSYYGHYCSNHDKFCTSSIYTTLSGYNTNT